MTSHHLECFICQDVLWKPVACQSCETPFCSRCINQWLANNPSRCPNRCKAYTERKCPPFVARLLAQLQMHCYYQSKDCEGICSYEGLNKHEAECDFQPSQCPGCKSNMAKKELENHKSNCAALKLPRQDGSVVYNRGDCLNQETTITAYRKSVQVNTHTSILLFRKEEIEKFIMSTAAIESLLSASREITIFIGFIGLISGLLGNTLNIIIFTSLKTFRETSCALYLTAASVFNILHLLASLLSRILITGYDIDLTETSSVLCKLRQFVAISGVLIALTCMCFATIDQFLSLTDRWKHLSQRPIAWWLIVSNVVFWFLCSIPALIYYNNVYASNTGEWSCAITNSGYSSYFLRFHVSFLTGFLQLILRIVFGLLAFINVRSLAKRRVPIIRLERDKQLTSMVLIEIVVNVVLSLPFFICVTYTSYISITDLHDSTRYQLIILSTNIVYYLTFAVGFYIYCCSSSRFRKQLIYVLVKVHSKYCCQVDVQPNNNQIFPQLHELQTIPAVIQSITINI